MIMMKRLAIAALAAVVWAGLPACSDDSQDPPDGTIARDVGPDAPDPAEMGVDLTVDSTPVDAGPTASMCAAIKYIGGAKAAGVDVIICNETECRTGTSGSTGSVCIPMTETGSFCFHVTEQKVSGKRLGDVLFPVSLSQAELAAGKPIDLGDVFVQEVGTGVLLDAKQGGTYNVGGGIELTVPAGAAKVNPLIPKPMLAGVVVDKQHIHPNMIAAKANLAAAYLVVPREITFSPGISFEGPAPAGLADGTALEIYAPDAETAKLDKVGEAKVSGGKIVDVSGKGLTALGMLQLYTK